MKEKPNLIGDQLKVDAYKFLNCQIKANKILKKRFNSLGDVHTAVNCSEIQLVGDISKLCEVIDEEVIREDWDYNEHCNTNYDIIYFAYRGYRFFELVDKVDKVDKE